MSTNFYIKCKSCGAQFHIAKRSCGWLPVFEAYPHDVAWYDGEAGYEQDETEHGRPRISSVKDIKDLVDSGLWGIVSEYGDDVPWSLFEKDVLKWKGGVRGKEPKSHVKPQCEIYYRVEKDEQGYEFCYYEFS